MTSRATRLAIVVAFFAAYAVVTILLWSVAFTTEGDRSRAALLGIAGVVTGGLLAVASGWFTAWRNGLAQTRREMIETRRSVYAQVESASRKYEYHRSEARLYYTARQRTAEESEKEALARASRDHRATATAIRLQLQAFLTTALYCTEPSKRTYVEELMEQVESADESPETEHGGLRLEAFRGLRNAID